MIDPIANRLQLNNKVSLIGFKRVGLKFYYIYKPFYIIYLQIFWI